MDFEVPVILFLAVVAPIWIIAHYATRWRATKSLSSDEEQLLEELWQSAERMEQRINSLERILDAEVTDWRKKL
ncbi:envelope stress response membrane protein PspB [Pelagibius sp.]|uniref:envelope stress response membrane protein PspB n=1 Tax=Pelagibius sp. TaxID=1931238 RepID=UPI002619269F|nr:envelope stress response membrane protein PspB [Pelagibius sp.]